MNHDYCAVGPRFVLVTHKGATTSDTLAVRANECPGRTSAVLHGKSVGDAFRIARPEPAQVLSSTDLVELLRLFVRICADFSRYTLPLEVAADAVADPGVGAALTTDGFSETPGGSWRRLAGVFTRQRPKAQTMEGVYEDLFSVPWNFVPREWDVLGSVIEQAPEAPLAVLDLGCGVGKNVHPLAERGWIVHGVDPSPTAIRRCRAVVADVARPDRFVIGTAASLPWRNATFDRVLDVGALHCMPPDERRAAVHEIARVLKPGGFVYSRFFKPRPASWLRLQPMAVDRFGLTVDDVRALLAGALACDALTEDTQAIYVRASRPDLR